MSQMNPDAIPKPGLGERAYQQIHTDIVWCVLHPGKEVSESSLCQAYGFGKAPVRQALARLVQEGYVISQPRRGHVISPITLKMVRDLFDLRLVVEPAIIESACGRVDRARLQLLNARCTEGYIPGDQASEARFMAANHAFHLEIAHAGGNDRMTRLLAEIMDEMTRMLHLAFVLRERPDEFRAEHAELIEALADNDPTVARDITLKHIRSVRAMTIDGIMTHTNLNLANIVPG